MDFEFDQEHRLLQQTVREFAQNEIRPLGGELTEEDEVEPIVQKAEEVGLIGVWIPEEYGGAGLGPTAEAIVKEEFFRADPGIGLALDTAAGSRMIHMFGRDEQRERYLPELASAESKSAIAISEPDAGSANRYMRTRAEPTGDGYLLNGQKMWISHAAVADYLTVFARTDPDSTPGDRDGISAFLVETEMDGIEINPIELMGLEPHGVGEIVFDDVELTADHLLGTEGEGYYHLLDWFNQSRNYVAPMALGIAQGAFELGLEYARQREAFGQKISEFQAIRHKLADMATEVEAARWLCYNSVTKAERGETSPRLASMAKLKTSEIAESVASDSLQIHGAYGYSTEFDIERFYRAAKVMQILEGTSEIQRNIIASRII